MIKITHIRAGKGDAERFKTWAKKKGLTSSKAFSLLIKKARI